MALFSFPFVFTFDLFAYTVSLGVGVDFGVDVDVRAVVGLVLCGVVLSCLLLSITLLFSPYPHFRSVSSHDIRAQVSLCLDVGFHAWCRF